LGKQLFDEVLEDGGIWHLYGHSWEIEELGIWDDLLEMLDYVSHHSNVTYLTNGQLTEGRFGLGSTDSRQSSDSAGAWGD
jgi:hypothetical protein